jgi:hypothetical protein
MKSSSKRLAQDLEDMAPELGPFIQKEHTMVRQRHLARTGEMLAADQSHIRDGMMRGRDTVGP